MIDHSTLSPSGRVSRRAEAAAKERNRRALFGDGLAFPQTEQEPTKDRLLRQARTLRELADRGMKPRAYRKEAARLEEEAERL